MGQGIVLAIVGLTSLAAYWLGAKLLRLSPRTLGSAVLRMTELVGIAIAFFAANLVVGFLVVMAIRALTNRFVSTYVLDDTSLVMLSTLQGLVFDSWRHSRR